MRVYWGESLTISTLLALLLAQARHRRPARLVCYEEQKGTSLTRIILGLAGISDIRAAAIPLGELTNSDGINLYWHNDNMMQAAAKPLVAAVEREGLPSRCAVPTGILTVFLGRAALADLHQTSLRSTMLWGNAKRLPNDQHCLLLRNSVFASEFQKFYQSNDLAIVRCLNLRRWWWPLREMLAICKQWPFSRTGQVSKAALPNSVAVQYVAGFDTTRISDIPWFSASGLTADQILTYADGPRVEEARAAARERGYRFADIGKWQPKFVESYRNNLLLALRAGISVLLSANLGSLAQRAWLSGWIMRFLRSRAKWEDFFRANNVLMHLHVGDADALALSATDALDRTGGIDFAFQLGGSGIELIFEHRAMTNRVMFAWGEFHRDMYSAIERDIPNKAPAFTIIGGHQHDHLIQLYRDKADEFRKKHHDNGISQIVVAFDNVCRRDFLISPNHIHDFYDCLLELAESDPTRVIVVKPKTQPWNGFDKDSNNRRLCLQAAGRWIELPAGASTFEAALHADVVVALHINTAAMEAAIADVPHVYYDTTAWGKHPFYKYAERLIATNRPRLRKLLDDHRRMRIAPSADPLLSVYRRALCPYTDGKSGHRMGLAIARLFSALTSGVPPANAVNVLKTNNIPVEVPAPGESAREA